MVGLLLLFLLACGLPMAGQPVVSTVTMPSQEEINTLVAGTANAAQIQTASALPSVTPTFTTTRIPSDTPTFTPTFIYLLSTATKVPSYTPIPPVGHIIVNGTITVDDRLTGRPWTCLVTGTSPAKDIVQKAHTTFYVTWAVMNTGTKSWWNNGVDFVHTGGYESNLRPVLDLPETVASGGSISLKIELTAPKKTGPYNVYWSLKVGNNSFCHMKYSFKVE